MTRKEALKHVYNKADKLLLYLQSSVSIVHLNELSKKVELDFPLSKVHERQMENAKETQPVDVQYNLFVFTCAHCQEDTPFDQFPKDNKHYCPKCKTHSLSPHWRERGTKSIYQVSKTLFEALKEAGQRVHEMTPYNMYFWECTKSEEIAESTFINIFEE